MGKITDNLDIKQIIKNYLLKYKKSIIIYLLIIILLILGIQLIDNNYRFYDTPIAKITSVENKFKEERKGDKGEVEKYYTQIIQAEIKNGEFKDKKIVLSNIYSSSQIYDDEYVKGDKVFVNISSDKSEEILKGTITGLKRDKYIAITISIFFLLLILVARKRGFIIFISLILNMIIFIYALYKYMNGVDLLLMSNILVLTFTIISMTFTSGFNKKTLAAIISTLISIEVVMLLFKIVIAVSDGIDYSAFEYMLNPNDLHKIFMLEIMIGGLGAIMDISISMASTMSELIEKDNNISRKRLLSSGGELGYDIMGTMINVLLFTYICGEIPLIILKMKNGFNLINLITLHMPFELYRFLIGSIGILIAIPISQLVSVLILKKGSRK